MYMQPTEADSHQEQKYVYVRLRTEKKEGASGTGSASTLSKEPWAYALSDATSRAPCWVSVDMAPLFRGTDLV